MLDIATATIKILAQPDQPVSLARTAPTANTAQMAAKARTDHQERFPTGITLSKKDPASNARPDPKDHPDHQDHPDRLPSPADPAAKETTANPAAPAQLVQQAMLAPPDPTANLARKANRVLMSNSEAKDRLVPKVKKEVPDQLAPTEKKDPLESQAPLARLVPPADLAKEAKMAAKDQTARQARKVAPVPTPSTVLARIVRRKRKPKSQFRLQRELDFRPTKTAFTDASIFSVKLATDSFDFLRASLLLVLLLITGTSTFPRSTINVV